MTDLDPDAITRYIVETFGGVDIVTASDDTFYFYDPRDGTPVDHMFPFATLVTGDRHDQASNLDRPGVFRLNVGVSRQTFQSLFGADATPDDAYDFTAPDTLLPHPVYGRMHWVCVLNPAAQTFETVQRLLAEAYERAAARHAGQHRADQQE
jgi:hypothetical protein